MTTLSPSEPLEAVMRQRWDAGTRTTGGDSGDAVWDAVRTVLDNIIDPMGADQNIGYYQWPVDDDSDSIPPHVGEAWIEELTAVVREAGARAFDAYVVPAVIRAIIERLPSVPYELATDPGAEILRADLARLEGQS